jgi:hypothetical protein
MINGIWIKKDVKIANPQNLWNLGYRNIWTQLDGNGCLYDNANTCAFYGFKLGLYHRLKYPPEVGSADSQAQEFMIAESALMDLKEYADVKFFPPVPYLAKGEPVLCETGAYRGLIMTFLAKYRSYHGRSENFILRATDEFIRWLAPTQQIVDSFKLWIHEPTITISYAPWKRYEYRSYVARSVGGNMVEPVEPWSAVVPPPVTPPPAPVGLTDAEKLAAIAKILAS